MRLGYLALRMVRVASVTLAASSAGVGGELTARAQSAETEDDALPSQRDAADVDDPLVVGDVALALGWRNSAARDEWTGGIVVSLPWDDWSTRASPASNGEASAPIRRAAHSVSPTVGPTPRSASLRPRASTTKRDGERLAPSLAITGGDREEAVREARRTTGLGAAEARLLQLASRARWSAAAPELRLRATRTVTESASLSPTEYDPLRQTATGGTSLWVEARATWHLDRLVFAAEELGAVRLERDLREEGERLAGRTVGLLDRWQAAVVERLDPASSYRECREALLRELQSAGELDRLTRGWFTRWRSQRAPLPEAGCLVAENLDPR